MKLYFASDHAGFELKEKLIAYARELGHDVEDCGAFSLDPGDDYPNFVVPCAQKVAGEEGSFGVIMGKSGQGEAMAANRVKGIRAAVYYGGAPDIPKLAREHNDANVLSLGAGFVSADEAKEALKTFLETPFSTDPRHARRIAKF